MALTKVIGSGVQGISNSSDATAITIDSSEKVGINTASPSDYYSDELVVTAADEGGMTFVTGTTHANYISFADGTSGNAAYRGFLKYDHNNDRMTLGTSGSSAIEIDANGHITKPLQSAFNAILDSTFTLSVGGYVDVVFGTERFDQNADYDTSNGIFTAPITGRYLFTTSLYLFNSLDTDASYYYMRLNTSNETVDVYFSTSTILNSDTNGWNFQVSSIQDMDASDTAKIQLYQVGGSAQTQIAMGHSNFTGALIC